MRRQIYYLVAVILLIFISCGIREESFDDKIYSHIKSDNSSKFKFSEVTNFNWDTLYLFNESCTKDDIERVLGQEFKEYKSISFVYVFTLNNKVTQVEEILYDVNAKGKIDYLFLNQEHPYKKVPRNQEFYINKNNIDDHFYYELGINTHEITEQP